MIKKQNGLILLAPEARGYERRLQSFESLVSLQVPDRKGWSGKQKVVL